MDVSSYVGLSGLMALERRLGTIANNVANAGTPGYRAEAVSFDTVVSRTRPFDTAFATEGVPRVDPQSGAITKTGNPLDVAIQGDGFLAIQTPQGIAYTRDGRLAMLPTGELVTSAAAYPVLDSSGSPLSLNAGGGAVTIGRDGMMRQDGQELGAIGLYTVDLSKGYTRTENAGFRVPSQPEAIDDFGRSGVVQGFVEQANVNPVLEMTRLIAVQRAFESMNASMEQRDSTLRETIQALGARSS
jgi:flagellar basal-body rod protein FlgF